MVLYICILKGCKDLVKKLVGVYISVIHLQVLYTPTSFLQEVYMKFIHLLLSNLIGQNVQAMVQV